ncbi:metal-dependent hydrolase [Methylibium sp.]|jgi:inner membrane protein|uniref:metal-dependent hydrolase n=1 Tax=Methylibium sp. TaxID=2067992 RepID=UPI003D0F0042
MDSLTQLALGAAVGIAVMRRRTAAWKAALWGGLCGTLPDLDAFIDHGDAISNMTLHRAESHALFYLTLAAPLLAGIIAWLHRERTHFGRWWLAVWLALVTHPLLDLMTVYGTQLARPFSDFPYAVGSIFIIDPLYTLPLLAGVALALGARADRGLRWNTVGLLLSTGYLAWSVVAQQHVTSLARASLEAQGLAARDLLVTPTPFNTVLWRVLALTPDGHAEGFYSLLDGKPRIAFERFPQDAELLPRIADNRPAQRIAAFSHGFFKVEQRDGQVRITDLRMGLEPSYFFSFVVAEQHDGRLEPRPPLPVGVRPDVQRTGPWLWRRLLGEPLPSPR